ncbi:MAG TPA: biopolymer transporter ExbD [Planctomycetaceae bacterium]|nr:biopolymer transporter ExbD [Planctomycetaceae bacterium]
MSHASAIDDDDGPLIKRKSMLDEAKFDITAMIDLVFMMNIFFLVTTVGAALAEMDLPTARHVVAADLDTAVILSLTHDPNGGGTFLYLGDGEDGEPIAVPEDQIKAVQAAVEAGVQAQKLTVLIKAEKNVKLRDVNRIATAASGVQGIELKLAVIEQEIGK